ncbi:MAG: YiiX/YebB-like N1pC/P60 family cysteine hydrolase [Candidatus Helarchaeota archaeon]
MMITRPIPPRWLLKLLANIRISPKPMFIEYNPKHHLVNGEEISTILDIIKEGDILLAKWNGYLSGYFIPGFWSHAAIYVGNRRVVESVGKGVQNIHLFSFLRTDNVCILRVKDEYSNLTKKACLAAEYAANQKLEYDYEFLDSNKKFYCSELVNYCYHNLFKDDYKKVLGINSISPDGIYNSDRTNLIIEFKHKKF